MGLRKRTESTLTVTAGIPACRRATTPAAMSINLSKDPARNLGVASRLCKVQSSIVAVYVMFETADSETSLYAGRDAEEEYAEVDDLEVEEVMGLCRGRLCEADERPITEMTL